MVGASYVSLSNCLVHDSGFGRNTLDVDGPGGSTMGEDRAVLVLVHP